PPAASVSELPTDLDALMERSFDARAEVEELAQAMRRHGPIALTRLRELEPKGAEVTRHARWRQLMDAVGAQRDASISHLFWYTDRAQASAVAREAGKPMISLRLLGRLTDERSCANSRMFRALLYAD